MDKLRNIISVIVGAVGGFLAYALGGFDNMLITLVYLTIVDYITGVLHAFYFKKISSYVGYKGVIKKITMYIVVSVAYMLEQNIGIPALREVVILFFISNEAISIIENISLLGVKLPKKLVNALASMQDKEESEEKEDE